MSTTYAFMSGMIMWGCAVASLFFVRFWRRTRDRLFLIFSVAFALLALERVAHAVLYRLRGEDHFGIFALRLVAFTLIALAIVDKNRSEQSPP